VSGDLRDVAEVLSAATEKVAEHLSKALAHRAVDEEVEWIGDYDAAVNDQRGRVASRVAEQIHVERVLDDHEQQKHGQRHFDHQKHADDNHQHHRGSHGRVTAAAPGRLALTRWIGYSSCGCGLRRSVGR